MSEQLKNVTLADSSAADLKETSTAVVEQTATKTSPGRRSLLGLGLPAAAAFLASACGLTGAKDFSGGGVKNKKPTPKPAVPPVTNGAAPGTGSVVPPGPAVPPPVVVAPAEPLCVFAGQAKVILTEATNTAALLPAMFPHALYGTRKSSMLAVNLVGLVAGDYVHILKPGATASEGITLASKLVTVSDAGVPLTFDNLNLTGVNALTAMVVSGTTKKRVTINTGDANYAVMYDSKQVYDCFGDHHANSQSMDGNYDTAYPLVVFGAPTVPFETPEFQKGYASADRHLKAAKSESSWSSAVTISVPAGFSYYKLTDAVGTPLTLDANVLKKTNLIIVYVQDGMHLHRYFLYIG